ncbi:MAG: hypothetical protein LLG00_10815 [Planctomycetaceae bacterium]|nr:hypothetical protein [Planctomycetaceae bacterium]
MPSRSATHQDVATCIARPLCDRMVTAGTAGVLSRGNASLWERNIDAILGPNASKPCEKQLAYLGP